MDKNLRNTHVRCLECMYNVGTVLYLFKTMSPQCVALNIVVVNRLG